MTTRSIQHPAARWLIALLFLLGASLAMAQSEPTLNQIYDAARAGHLDQAQSLMKQVLAAHPNSAKAHFVEAELLAQQGRIDAARQSLATAERLQPGLTFASPEALSGLRARLSGSGLNGLSGVGPRTSSGAVAAPSRVAPASSSGPSFGLFWPVLLIIAGIALFLFFRRRSAATRAAAYVPQTYGVGAGAGAGGFPVAPSGAAGAVQPYNQPYGQAAGQPYGQPVQQGSGLGSRIAGGLATGAAIGAGMMAAQAIGRSITGQDSAHAAQSSDASAAGRNVDAPIPAGDLGGQNFGIADTSWDDSSPSAGDVGGGGGDWDS